MDKWISVNDRLPDKRKCGLYLVANGAARAMAYWFDGMWRESLYLSGDKEALPVTHWMALPEPPEDTDADN